MLNNHDLARATIAILDEAPPTPERARHKLAMIRIAEYAACKRSVVVSVEADANQIVAAAEYCGTCGL